MPQSAPSSRHPIVVIARFTYHGETVLKIADILLDSHHYDLEYTTTVETASGRRTVDDIRP